MGNKIKQRKQQKKLKQDEETIKIKEDEMKKKFKQELTNLQNDMLNKNPNDAKKLIYETNDKSFLMSKKRGIYKMNPLDILMRN